MALSGWIDQAIVELAVRAVITSAIGTAPAEFIKDRGDLYFEPGWSEESLKAGLRPSSCSLARRWSTPKGRLRPPVILPVTGRHGPMPALPFAAWFLRGRWADGADFLSRYPAIERLEAELAANAESHDSAMTGEQALAVALEAEPTLTDRRP